MTELSDKQARLEKLYKARDSGVASIRHGDERVDYRSMDELLQAISALESEIATLSGTTSTRGPRYLYQSGKGL